MITLRCTLRLDKYLGLVPAKSLEITTAALGDWYANLLHTVSGDLIMFVNEKTLLTVALPTSEASNLVPLFRLRVANLLGMIGINREEIVNEISHYGQVQIGRTASRRIVGSMNDIGWQYQAFAEAATSDKDLSLSTTELILSQMPCKPIGYRFPVDIAKELLKHAARNAS